LSLLTPNTDFTDDFSIKGKFILTWRIALVILLLVLFMCLNEVFYGEFPRLNAPRVVSSVMSVVCMLYLYLTKKYKITYWIYCILVVFFVNLAFFNQTQTTHYSDLIWMVSSILLAFIGIGRFAGLLLFGVNLLSISIFFYFKLNIHFEYVHQFEQEQLIGEFIEFLFSIFLVTYLIYQFTLFQNNSEYESDKKTKVIHTKNSENEILVKEIHHRVKNNLQVIISMLRLQKYELKSEETIAHFSEAINRIMVMSLIHQKLYQEKELSRVEIKNYLSELTKDILSLSDLGFPVEIKINSNIDKIGLKTIVPLGLLVNELVSNSIKHAFVGKKEGLIEVNIKKGKSGYILLDYFDNGIWNAPTENYSSFGLDLIDTLTSQLDGEMKKSSSGIGTSFNFTLLNLDHDKNIIDND
jgi:two-component sensor histidine kinase